MIKNYEQYKPNEVAMFLKKELFSIEVDKLAAMDLKGDYEQIPDTINDIVIPSLNKKERLLTSIYGLVKLYENGHTIRVVKSDDIINIYALVFTHFKNIDNLSSGSIHPVKIDTEGLQVLAMLTAEIFRNNKISLNKHQLDMIEEKMKLIKPLSVTDFTSVFREFDYISTSVNRSSVEQGQQGSAVLEKAKRELLY